MPKYPQQTTLEPMTFAEAISGVRLIPLTKGQHAIVDWEDVPEVTKRKWCVNNGYAARAGDMQTVGRGKMVKLHRIIMNAPEGLEVDHINHNPLDNRRSNLRLATRSENGRNRKIERGNACGIKGVCRNTPGKKWVAYITLHRRRKHLGSFENIEDAAAAYAKAAREMHGEFHCIDDSRS